MGEVCTNQFFCGSRNLTFLRVYYRRGDRNSLGAPDSSTEASDSRPPTAQTASRSGSLRTNTPSEAGLPFSIYRPRNRPHQHQSEAQTDSMAIEDAPSEPEVTVFGPMTWRPISESSTPRLRPDRRSNQRLSVWQAPSFDESFGSMVFSRQNRQILLFCLGFILPFGKRTIRDLRVLNI